MHSTFCYVSIYIPGFVFGVRDEMMTLERLDSSPRILDREDFWIPREISKLTCLGPTQDLTIPGGISQGNLGI